MDLVAFCKSFYDSTNIPVSYFQWPDNYIWSCPPAFQRMNGRSDAFRSKISFRTNPDYFITDSYAYFGIINIDDSPSKCDFLIVGPAFSTPCTDESVHAFLHEAQLDGEDAEEMAALLFHSPQVSLHQFLSVLVFLHQCVNNKVIRIEDHFSVYVDETDKNAVSRKYSGDMYNKREENDFHNSWEYERLIAGLIRAGQVESLRNLLIRQLPDEPWQRGVLASSLLRSRRNLFITMTTFASRAAIEGGLDSEQALQLSDLYIQECERTLMPERLDTLAYTMLIDFAGRVARTRLPAGELSAETYKCLQFISQHTNEPLRVDDVAAFIGKSRSYITRRFKSETGFDISFYIKRCKLEEAKSLLSYTDKPLSEISSYLCFSSQSYFQNVFKREYGVTPMQYRLNSGSAVLR